MSIFSKADPRKLAKKIYNEAKRDIDKVVDRAEDGIRSTGSSIQRKISYQGQELLHDLEDKSKQLDVLAKGHLKVLEHRADALGEELEARADAFSEELEDRAEEIVKEVIAAAQSKALQILLDYVQLFLPSSFTLELGVIAFTVPGITEKVDYFQEVVKNPPTSSAEVVTMLRKFGAATVTVKIGGGASFVVFNTNVLGGSGSFDIETEDFIAKIDKVL